nr:hypothetical protein [Endozoicomonas sp.]
MDNVTNSAIKKFADHVSRLGSVNFNSCGINTNNTFVFGRTVSENEHDRLLLALNNHPSLSGLVRTVKQ